MYSEITQVATQTISTTRALYPKKIIEAMRAGTRAMITSRIRSLVFVVLEI
jgi:hypothetical protein